ncbi:MAG: prolipoprotein diacylglyceryl transferase [Candidatus Liberibacter europaeus]|uniref:Phosphatidylglycerol--prolipoprotein diacylglyceryl transferase n=1 Tax=Candidatus Liberibacter europaeus TaxID=744859 RepID=A0A2T4VYS8_9HYPH|nr:prolipoprotein diacylglyceryl transferase [Candidatus Liberibacter europaeus]PTL86913.1 MAG: prolipoprotein diacylglyceryl transferase [Candidatus Liberibacter europaeus]
MLWSILAYPQINPIAISFGVISVRWYGLAYAAGALFSVWCMQSLLRRNNLWTEQQNKYNRIHINDDTQGSCVFWIIIGLILGGRIFYFILYNLDLLLYFPLHILYVWEGGMSFHGAFFGVFLSLFLLSRIYKFSFWVFSDLLATSAPFGIFLGRIANFINGELFGKVSWMPWSMVFPSGGDLPRHPSQLYEAFLEGIVLFLIMQVIVYRGALKKPGFATGVFICGYAISRIVVEFFREPDVQLGYIMGEWMTMGMLLSFPMLIIGIWCIVRAIILEKNAFCEH